MKNLLLDTKVQLQAGKQHPKVKGLMLPQIATAKSATKRFSEKTLTPSTTRADQGTERLRRVQDQRKEWCENYDMTEGQLFERFSEFSAMMLITRSEVLEKEPSSFKQKFARLPEAKDYLADVLPFGGSIATHRKDKHNFDQKLKKLSIDELKDFRVPLQVYKENATAIAKSKDAMKNRILRAVGIDVSSKHAKIDWETFLLVNKVMSLKCEDRDTQVNFAVRLFDPAWTGFLSASEFETIWSGIFQ